MEQLQCIIKDNGNVLQETIQTVLDGKKNFKTLTKH